MKAELLVNCQNQLGEGVQWHRAHQRLYWVDIEGCEFWSCDEFGQNLQTMKLEERLCSFCFHQNGSVLAAFASGLYELDYQTGKRKLLSRFEPNLTQTRLNDGKCDRQGRFICGGYNEVEKVPLSHVFSYDGIKITPLIQEVICTNGLAFSPQGTQMYFTDTATRKIKVYPYDPETGMLGNERLFCEMTESEGSPDGSTVDAEGALWNAQFRGGVVQRFLPEGTRDIRVEVGVPNVTCVCFGGKNLNKLYITTARHKMSLQDLEKMPTAGGLFMIQTTPIIGIEETLFQKELKQVC